MRNKNGDIDYSRHYQLPCRHAEFRITAGTDHLRFYNSERDQHDRILPCKVSCVGCGAPVADEGRRMWLAFPSLFDFGHLSGEPAAFRPSCHNFYGSLVIEVGDALPKWAGHKNDSLRL